MRSGHGPSLAYTDVSAPVRRKRYWPAFGHLYRGGSSRCDGSIASQIIVASKHECGNYVNLANLFVQVNRLTQARSTHPTR